MNILVVAHFQNDGSPTAVFIHDQVKAYVRLGHSVRIIVPIAVGKRWYRCVSPGPRAESIDGVAHILLRYLSLSKYGEGGFNTRSAVAAMRASFPQILEGFAPDIIHAHTLGLDSELGGWLKKKLGCPLVVTTHGSDTSIPFEQGRLPWLRERCDQADTVVAVSAVLAGKLRTCGTKTTMVSILNGFNFQHLPAAVPKTPLSFLQVCNLIPQKRVDVTIRAFAEIYDRYPAATLTLIGQGAERAALEALCRALGVSQSVRFAGQLPNVQVLSEMAKTRFFVMPSVREGFGIVYLEAMACGCVTIGTEGEGIADLIVPGQNGILVPPDDPEAIVQAVQDCLKHPEKAAALAENGRQSAVGLTWEKNAAQYVQLMRELNERK